MPMAQTTRPSRPICDLASLMVQGGTTLVTSGFGRFEPLSDEEIARLGRQDTQGMTLNGVSGSYGSRFSRWELKAGKYAFVVFDERGAPEEDPVGIPPLSMEILEILP